MPFSQWAFIARVKPLGAGFMGMREPLSEAMGAPHFGKACPPMALYMGEQEQ
jgi:hypothetical protein